MPSVIDLAPGRRREDEPFAIGDLSIDAGRRSVKLCGRSLSLTAKEFDLLLYLARNPGRVFSRSKLLDRVWGYGHDGYEHTVNSHINRLRAKLERDPRQPDYVMTVWGVGYKLADPPIRQRGRRGMNSLRLKLTAAVIALLLTSGGLFLWGCGPEYAHAPGRGHAALASLAGPESGRRKSPLQRR